MSKDSNLHLEFDFLSLLRRRRSIRRFLPEPVPPEMVMALQEAVLLVPSSRNQKPWEFVFVDDRSLLVQLSHARPDGASAFVAGAALAVAVCGDPRLSDVWIEDCSIAAFALQLTAHSLALASCWVQIRRRQSGGGKTAEEYVREVLHIPQRLRILSLVAIGFPAETKPPRAVPDSLLRSKISLNRYGQRV